MKKINKFLILVLLATICASLCSCGILEKIQGPEDKWQQTSFKYKDVELDCYFLYSDDDFSIDTSKSDFQKLDAGLTIIVTPNKEKNTAIEAIEAIGKLFGTIETEYYFCKTFKKGEQMTLQEESDTEIENEPKSFTLNKTKWTIIYNCLKFTETKTPDVVTETNYKDVMQDNSLVGKFSFDWESILAEMLIDKINDLLG